MTERAVAALTVLGVAASLAGCGASGSSDGRSARDERAVTDVGLRDKLKKPPRNDEASIRQMLRSKGASSDEASRIVQLLSRRLTADEMHVWLSHPEKSHPVPDPEAAKKGASARGLLARIRREHRRDQREWFDVENDPNDVLRAALERLERDGDVDRTVGHTPTLGLDNRTIERLRESTQDESVDDLRERLIVAEKRRELEGIVERSPFVLIESDWRVDVTGAAVSMALKTLRPAYLAHDGYGHGPDPDLATTAVSLPSELSISATFPADGLADKGASRLTDGATVRAGVLATIATYRDGMLELAPIAVFGRHGALRESIGVGC